MSSIVSRNPPPSGSTSQAKDFFWMSIRLGTSIDLSRRANVRRVREASTEAKTATPRAGRDGAGKIAARNARHQDARLLTDPVQPGFRMWRKRYSERLRWVE